MKQNHFERKINVAQYCKLNCYRTKLAIICKEHPVMLLTVLLIYQMKHFTRLFEMGVEKQLK